MSLARRPRGLLRPPDYESEYNHLSLREARRNVRQFVAVTPEAAERTRDPDEPRDPNWPYERARRD